MTLFFFFHLEISIVTQTRFAVKTQKDSLKSHSLLHPFCCYLYRPRLTAEWSRVAYVTDITESPVQAGPRGCGQFTSRQLSRATTPRADCAGAAESNGGDQTFHLLWMSFLAVLLLLEEERHWCPPRRNPRRNYSA